MAHIDPLGEELTIVNKVLWTGNRLQRSYG